MNIKPVFCRYVELLAVWTAVLTLSVMAVLLVVSVAAYTMAVSLAGIVGRSGFASA